MGSASLGGAVQPQIERRATSISLHMISTPLSFRLERLPYTLHVDLRVQPIFFGHLATVASTLVLLMEPRQQQL